MTLAITELTVRVLPETTFRSSVIDPMPTYPDHAGKLGVDLVSGGLRIDFTYGYAWPADIHAAIARLRDALDRLDIDVDAAIGRQAIAALPDGVEFVGTVCQFLDAITDQAPGELVEARGK